MLFGFGERGFNPHRRLFEELGEPIDVCRHGALCRLSYGDASVVFWPEIDRFLITFFLAIHGTVLGTRAMRAGDGRHSLEEVLATGWCRLAVVRDRSRVRSLWARWRGRRGAAAVGIELDTAGRARLATDSLLFGFALASVAALVVAVFRRGGAATAMAVSIGARFSSTTLCRCSTEPRG